MPFSLTKEQIENLKSWKSGLQSEQAVTWMREEEQAEVEIHKLFDSVKFGEGNDLSAEQLDEYFHLLRNFSNNRNLSNLLYRSAGIKKFNDRLRNLLYGKGPLYLRVEEMFKLKGMGMQTVSQFLIAHDPKKYAIVTRQTTEMLGLDAAQEKQAQDEAISRNGIKDSEKLFPNAVEMLRYYVVFEEIKKLLSLEKYSQVNNLIWFGRMKEGAPASESSAYVKTSESRIVIDAGEFKQKEYSREDEFELEIEKNAKLIFGEKSTYYPIKSKIGSRICDAILYDKENDRVVIVENEIQSHDLYEHIVPQIIGFFNGMKDENTRLKLKHEINWREDEQKHIVRAIDYHQYDVLVVIDAADFDVSQASKNISNILRKLVGEKYDPTISFKEVSIYENKEGKKAFRIRNL